MHCNGTAAKPDANKAVRTQTWRYVAAFAKGFGGAVLVLLAVFAIIYFSAAAVQAEANRAFGDFYMAEPYWADTSESSEIPLKAYNAATGYRSTLSVEHQKAYDDLEFAMRNMDFFCAFEPGTVACEDVEMIYDSVLYDNPDICWCGAKYIFAPDLTGHALGMFPVYLYNAPEAVRLHAKLIEKVEEQCAFMEEELPQLMADEANAQAIGEKNCKVLWETSYTPVEDINDSNSSENTPQIIAANAGALFSNSIGSFFKDAVIIQTDDNADQENTDDEPVQLTADDMIPVESDEIPYISNTIEEKLTYEHNEYDQTASAFINDSDEPGKTVCVGYSKIYKLLCDRAGIECYIVSGCQYGDPSSSHAWNMAYAENGDVYFIDATWADDDREHADNRYKIRTSTWCSTNGINFDLSHMPGRISEQLPIVADGQAETEIEKAERDKRLEEGKSSHIWGSNWNVGTVWEAVQALAASFENADAAQDGDLTSRLRKLNNDCGIEKYMQEIEYVFESKTKI